MLQLNHTFYCPECDGELRDRICHACHVEVAPVELQGWKWWQKALAAAASLLGFEYRLSIAYRRW